MATGAGTPSPARVGALRDWAARGIAGARAWIVNLLCLMIRIYQCLVSPLLGNCCRFEPSCSRYAQLCIERLGPVRGSWLALLRLLRCHPFCPGGHDPPPEVTS
jgi:putative membrane protein insertion efficiency factor